MSQSPDEPSPETPARPSDTRTVVLAVLAVLAVGALIFAGLLAALHRGGGGPNACGGKVAVGDAKGLAQQVDDSGGAFYQTLGGRCEYWVTVHGGKVVTLQARLPGRTCAVRYKSSNDTFSCDGEVIPWDRLGRWPSRTISSGPNVGLLEIDFGPN